MDSSVALELVDIPDSLFIFGGGYVALELGTVYASLGTRVTLAVRSDRLLRGADPDLAEPLVRKLQGVFEAVHFNTTVSSLKESKDTVEVVLEGEVDKPRMTFDRVLIAIGRKPNSGGIGLETTKVTVNERGFVVIDEQQRTADEKIFAIGDVSGGPLLAHKAFREGKVAAEVIAGEPSGFDVHAMPAVVYTDPQVAWCGLTETQARKEDRAVRVEHFPWKFSSRAVTMDAASGMTKIIVDRETERVLGIGVVGKDAEGLIAEGVVAVEMGALAQDLALSVHPHPTLSETLGEVAELVLGSPTHMLPKQSMK